jgi:pimeloyl-ACP methyl ester carboxylesterase
VHQRRRALGAARYLAALEWSIVDELADLHRRITAPVRLIWGAEDPTFPLERARAMASHFARATFTSIPRAKLLVHEEHPAAVAAAIEARNFA